MNYEQMNNNKVYLRGTIMSSPVYTHEAYEEAFYEINLKVDRLSKEADIIPITMSEKLMHETNLAVGTEIAIKGQFRSYNRQLENKSKLVLTVFVREFCEIDKDLNPNTIELVGFVCKEPIFRTTPFKREICDILIAVNRAYNKSDYLPCIAWGRNARFCNTIKVGEKVTVFGRIQSRIYQKKIDETTTQTNTAYEISISQVNLQNTETTTEQNIIFAQNNTTMRDYASN